MSEHQVEDRHFLWLRPGIQLLVDGSDLTLISPDGAAMQLPDPKGLALRLVERLDGAQTAAELSKNPYFPVITPLLRERGWLVTLQRPLKELLSRSAAISREIAAFAHLYPAELDWHFSRMAAKSVLIVGAGGIGTCVSFALCANGVGRLTIVDPDRVELTNLNRQFLYTASDLKAPKVEVLKRELAKRFPMTAVHGVVADFDSRGQAARTIQNNNLVVICGESTVLYDKPKLCDSVPMISSGYQGAIGVVGPLFAPRLGTACLSCVMDKHLRPAMRVIEHAGRPSSMSWNPSGYAINSMTGAMCAQICVAVLSEQPSVTRWFGVRVKVLSNSLQVEHCLVEPRTCPHSSQEGL